LDSVLESEREKQRVLKEETDSQLESFRKQRDRVEGAAGSVDIPATIEPTTIEWASAGKKRKAAHEKNFMKGLKLRKTSAPKPDITTRTAEKPSSPQKAPSEEKLKMSIEKPNIGTITSSATPNLGLVAYSSDEDD